MADQSRREVHKMRADQLPQPCRGGDPLKGSVAGKPVLVLDARLLASGMNQESSASLFAFDYDKA